MLEISPKRQKLLLLFLRHASWSSSQLHEYLLKAGEEQALVTVKRELTEMVKDGLIVPGGQGRARSYQISAVGRLFSKVDARTYGVQDPDTRYGLARFNFELFSAWPADIFTAQEHAALERATDEYRRRTADLPRTIEKKELERLIIELAWKSSKIEGNTYTLLDTEKLILKHQKAPGHDKKEARMILNHKDAFTLMCEHAKDFRTLTRDNLEQLHGILVKGLSVGLGFRKKPVGVVGSLYHPLDNFYQIREAVEALAAAVSKAVAPYGKALTALLGISYIQPFEDGNKRTARLMANALLLAYKCAPLSYRSVDEKEYREAILTFYELNSLIPFKKIFIEQYEFAAKNYAVAAGYGKI